MEKQVLSIKQMQELKELGINISKASCTWCKVRAITPDRKGYSWMILPETLNKFDEEHIPTFTLSDILNILPDIRVNNTWYIPLLYKSGDLWVVDYHCAADFNKTFLPNGIDIMCCCETALEAAFNMLIWCKEENYI